MRLAKIKTYAQTNEFLLNTLPALSPFAVLRINSVEGGRVINSYILRLIFIAPVFFLSLFELYLDSVNGPQPQTCGGLA